MHNERKHNFILPRKLSVTSGELKSFMNDRECKKMDKDYRRKMRKIKNEHNCFTLLTDLGLM